MSPADFDSSLVSCTAFVAGMSGMAGTSGTSPFDSLFTSARLKLFLDGFALRLLPAEFCFVCGGLGGATLSCAFCALLAVGRVIRAKKPSSAGREAVGFDLELSFGLRDALEAFLARDEAVVALAALGAARATGFLSTAFVSAGLVSVLATEDAVAAVAALGRLLAGRDALGGRDPAGGVADSFFMSAAAEALAAFALSTEADKACIFAGPPRNLDGFAEAVVVGSSVDCFVDSALPSV